MCNRSEFKVKVNNLFFYFAEPNVFMQVVVKESSSEASNSRNQKRKKKKMMQLVIENDGQRHSHTGFTNNDQELQRHTNVQTSDRDADVQKSDALRRTDDHLFNELDANNDNDVMFRRESRKSGQREEFPYFLNFPPVTSPDKKATSYTRISFAKPANFNFDHPGDNSIKYLIFVSFIHQTT